MSLPSFSDKKYSSSSLSEELRIRQYLLDVADYVEQKDNNHELDDIAEGDINKILSALSALSSAKSGDQRTQEKIKDIKAQCYSAKKSLTQGELLKYFRYLMDIPLLIKKLLNTK
jgi:hypothetical protein